MTSVKIYSVCHNDFGDYQNDLIFPIQAGSAVSSKKLQMLSDDKGENISNKNPNYCELTAMYNIWKNNIKSDYVGFCHYRRHFAFNKINNKSALFTEKNINKSVFDKYGYNNNEFITDLISKYDVILPKKVNLERFTVEQQYKFYHPEKEWDALIETINELYPQYSKTATELYSQNEIHLYNIFIMKWDLFEEYMEFLFNILFNVEKKIEISTDPFHKRVFGFLGERLTALFVYKKLQEQDLKIAEIPLIFFHLDKVTENKLEAIEIEDKFNEFVDKNKDKKICLYGAGAFAEKLLGKFDFSKLNVVGFIDGNANNKAPTFKNYSVYSIDEIDQLNPDLIILTVLSPTYLMQTLKTLPQMSKYLNKITSDLFIF